MKAEVCRNGKLYRQTYKKENGSPVQEVGPAEGLEPGSPLSGPEDLENIEFSVEVSRCACGNCLLNQGSD